MASELVTDPAEMLLPKFRRKSHGRRSSRNVMSMSTDPDFDLLFPAARRISDIFDICCHHELPDPTWSLFEGAAALARWPGGSSQCYGRLKVAPADIDHLRSLAGIGVKLAFSVVPLCFSSVAAEREKILVLCREIRLMKQSIADCIREITEASSIKPPAPIVIATPVATSTHGDPTA